MGLGSPADLLDAVDQGIDLFDSVLPSRVARTGQVWVPGGRLNLRNAAFLDDPAPIQDGLPVPRLPALLAGVPRPPVPGAGAARVPARDVPQPDLHAGLHGPDPGRDRGRTACRTRWPSCGSARDGTRLARMRQWRVKRQVSRREAAPGTVQPPRRKPRWHLEIDPAAKPRRSAQGQVGRAQAAADGGAADERRADPQAAQAAPGRGRQPGRGLIRHAGCEPLRRQGWTGA